MTRTVEFVRAAILNPDGAPVEYHDMPLAMPEAYRRQFAQERADLIGGTVFARVLSVEIENDDGEAVPDDASPQDPE